MESVNRVVVRGRVYLYPRKSGGRKPYVHHPDFKYKSNNVRLKRTHGLSIREQCLERDDYRCQICGRKNTMLYIHHLDNKGEHLTKLPNNALSNLQTLCGKCHQRLHRKISDKWREIYYLRNAGLTLRDIGLQYGVSRQRIYQILRKYAEILDKRKRIC